MYDLFELKQPIYKALRKCRSLIDRGDYLEVLYELRQTIAAQIDIAEDEEKYKEIMKLDKEDKQ